MGDWDIFSSYYLLISVTAGHVFIGPLLSLMATSGLLGRPSLNTLRPSSPEYMNTKSWLDSSHSKTIAVSTSHELISKRLKSRKAVKRVLWLKERRVKSRNYGAMRPADGVQTADPVTLLFLDLIWDDQSEPDLGTARNENEKFCSKPAFGAERLIIVHRNQHYTRKIYVQQRLGGEKLEEKKTTNWIAFKSGERNIKMTENNGDCLSRLYLRSVDHISPFPQSTCCSF